MQQETAVISPINAAKFNSKHVQNIRTTLKIYANACICTYIPAISYSLVPPFLPRFFLPHCFLFLCRCVIGVCFPPPLRSCFASRRGLAFIGSKTPLAARSPRAVGCRKVKMSETPGIISRKFLCSMEGAIGLYILPVVPHKAVAEVSKIGNL